MERAEQSTTSVLSPTDAEQSYGFGTNRERCLSKRAWELGDSLCCTPNRNLTLLQELSNDNFEGEIGCQLAHFDQDVNCHEKPSQERVSVNIRRRVALTKIRVDHLKQH